MNDVNLVPLTPFGIMTGTNVICESYSVVGADYIKSWSFNYNKTEILQFIFVTQAAKSKTYGTTVKGS